MRSRACRTAAMSFADVVVVIGAASDCRGRAGCESALARTSVGAAPLASGRGRGIGMVLPARGAATVSDRVGDLAAALIVGFAALVLLAAALVVGLAAGLAACFLDASVALADLLAGAGAAVCFFGWGSVAAVRWPPSAIRDAKANARVAATWFLGIVILFPWLLPRTHPRRPGPPLRRDSCGRFVPPSPFTKP